MKHEVVESIKVSPYVYVGMKIEVSAVPKKYTIENIILSVEMEYKTKVELRRVKTRRREYVEPRQMIMLLTRELTAMSLKKIGEYLAGNDAPYDHTTVLHSCTSISNQISTNDKIKAIYNNIKLRL